MDQNPGIAPDPQPATTPTRPRRRRRIRRVAASTPLVTGPIAEEEPEEIKGPWVSVPAFRHFQHYGTRKAPWIKVSADWLADYRYQRLSDHQKLALFYIWLLASKGNRVRADPEYIQWKVGMENPVDLHGLIEAGFLELHGGKLEDIPGVKLSTPKPITMDWRAVAGTTTTPPLPLTPAHERALVWPPSETEERNTDELVDRWEKRQP